MLFVRGDGVILVSPPMRGSVWQNQFILFNCFEVSKAEYIAFWLSKNMNNL
jgi:hypothetical protein